MSSWTPERDAALADALNTVSVSRELEMASLYGFELEDVVDLRAAWLAERAEVERLLVAAAERSYARSIQGGDDEGELLAARQAVSQLALGHLSVPSAIERLNRIGLDVLDRVQTAETEVARLRALLADVVREVSDDGLTQDTMGRLLDEVRARAEGGDRG